MYTLQTQCTDRKDMVQKLAAFMDKPATYLRTPTYAFQIGKLTVNRDGSITGEEEDLKAVADFLLDNGFISERPEELAEKHYTVAGETTSADEPITNWVSFPVNGMTPRAW